MQYKKAGRRHIYIFDSMDEHVTTVRKQYDRFQADRTHTGDLPGNASFMGRRFENWDEVQAATRSLWPEGMKVYSDMMEKFRHVEFDKPKNIRRVPRWSEDDGDDLDIDRLRSGAPYWRQMHRDHRPGPQSVTIVTDICAHYGVQHHNILWRGAAAVTLSTLLESAGYRVELWAGQNNNKLYRNGDDGAQLVCYKRCEEPLDVSSLINGVSGWYFRSLGFAGFWLHPELTPDYPGYGPVGEIDGIVSHVTTDENVIVCQKLWDFNAGVTWIQKQLKRFTDPIHANN